MTCDLAKFEEFLRNRHYSVFMVKSSKNIAIRMLDAFSVEEIISTDVKDLIDKLTSASTNKSKRIYRSKAALFKRYLTQEAQA